MLAATTQPSPQFSHRHPWDKEPRQSSRKKKHSSCTTSTQRPPHASSIPGKETGSKSPPGQLVLLILTWAA